MKVVYSRSGGIGGPMMSQHLEVDTDDLAENEASELKDLVADAGLDKPQAVNAAPAHPDAFNYRITVSDLEHTQTSISSDAEMPEKLSPLIDWLSERAARKP